MTRVVVTGLGVVSPNGVGVPDFLSALRVGTSGLRFNPRLRDLNFTCQVSGIPELPESAVAAILKPDQMLASNSCMRFAAIAGVECWKDGGFSWYPGERSEVDWDTAVFFGTGMGALDTICDTLAPLTCAGRVRRLGSITAEQAMCSSPSAFLAGILGLGGQTSSNSSACATGTEAVVNAFRHLRHGYAERVIAGAADGPSVFSAACFDGMRVTAKGFNSEPSRASRPLSATAAGFVPASGAGALLLESLESATRRGARIYAEVLGGSVNCGGQRNGGTMTAANTEGMIRCVRGAIKESGLPSSSIDYINGHLTATAADPKEIEVLRSALRPGTDRFPWINSTKSMIGHTLGAAGAIECVATLLQLEHQFLHPSLNCEDPNPAIAAVQESIVRTPTTTALRVALKTSFGFGDVNACVLFSKWRPSEPVGYDE